MAIMPQLVSCLVIVCDRTERNDTFGKTCALSDASACTGAHEFQLFQAELRHFVNNLHLYVMTRVLHSTWTEHKVCLGTTSPHTALAIAPCNSTVCSSV